MAEEDLMVCLQPEGVDMENTMSVMIQICTDHGMASIPQKLHTESLPMAC